MTDNQKTRAQLIAEIEALRDELSSSRANASSAELSDAGRYRHILENVRAIMVESDDEGRISYVSPTLADILGYLPGEIQSITRSLISDGDFKALGELYAKIRATGQSGKTIVRVLHKNGEYRWLETTLDCYQDSAGETRTVALCRDVTTQHEAVEALRNSEARYRRLADVSRAHKTICMDIASLQ